MAYIMDTNEEERAKGKTVEVGMAHFESSKKRFTILDAPGHKNYVPQMTHKFEAHLRHKIGCRGEFVS